MHFVLNIFCRCTGVVGFATDIIRRGRPLIRDQKHLDFPGRERS